MMEPTDSTRDDNLSSLRAMFNREMIEHLSDVELQAILSNRSAAVHPQPVDYGLTHDDMRIYDLASLGQSELKYKEENKANKWFGRKSYLAIWFVVYVQGFIIYAALHPEIPGGWTWNNEHAVGMFLFGMLTPGLFPGIVVFGLVFEAIVNLDESHKRRHPTAGVLAYREAFQKHRLYLAAADEAEQALQRKKQSYWESLNGYEFERQTAEVLKRYRFNPKVTRGSADGGVDIEVSKGGRKGVVQCKAHAARVAPAIVRDLFGVMHHSNSDFGIIVSLGGFTKGAVEFAKNKPIFLLDCSDLIAMQEGQDILAKNFPADPTP
jgi:HJR/Mrr/RecB family endonuclease